MAARLRIVPLLALCLASASSSTDSGVRVIQSAENTPESEPDRLNDLGTTPWSSEARNGGSTPITLKIDPDQTYQTIQGFGGAFTDSSAYVFAQLNETMQARVIEMFWGDDGQRYNLARVPIGATDFSTSVYSYNEVVGDYAMSNFSLSHDGDDLPEIIPYIQSAQRVNGDIEFLATPWSAPSWLKRNAHIRNSLHPGLVQDEQTFSAYALYLSKFVTAMKDEGIEISRMTVQNEPHVAGQVIFTYPSMGYEADDERDFLCKYLGPRMAEDHPDVGIYVHDDQKMKDEGDTFMVDRVATIMADAECADKYVAGAAFHWYGANLKNYEALATIHEAYPELPLLATEATLKDLTLRPWAEGSKYATDLIGDLNNWAQGWIEWNLLLNSHGGPTCIGPGTGKPDDEQACWPVGNCDAPLRVEIDADGEVSEWKVSDSYWHMGHFSRYIPRGSVRVAVDTSTSSEEQTIEATAVRTPSGEVVAVVLNTGSDAQAFTLESSDGRFVELEMPPNSIQTLIFDALDETVDGGVTLPVASTGTMTKTDTVNSATRVSSDCPYSVFNWVGHVDDNPYFWQSPSFDWNATTTLGVFGDITDSTDRIEMRDYAQSRGVKVVTGTSPSDIDMNNATQRNEWVEDRVAYAIEQGLDGLNVDYEGHKPSLTQGYNEVVVQLCEAMHAALPGSEVSVDLPFYPEYEGRNYDYARIAEACDSLFVMAYDGEFWDNIQCIATDVNCSQACAPIEMTELGIQQYLARGVDASKIYLGLPWYGLKYESFGKGALAKVPFFSGQIDYEDIVAAINAAGDAGSVTVDEKSSTMVFDCGGLCSQWSDKITDRTDHIWYDNAQTLAPKYALASKYGLKGVGMWESTKVVYDPTSHTADADEMWDSLCQRE